MSILSYLLTQRAEIGYLLNGTRLDENNFSPNITSIRRLAHAVDIPFEDLLRGENSFGGMLEQEGYEAVPSPTNPGPDGNPFFA